MLGTLRQLAQDRTGTLAVTLGLSLVPVVGMAGAALDYTRAATARADLQNAVDRAALAAIRAEVPTATQRYAIATATFADGARDAIAATATPTGDARLVTVSAIATLDTAVVGVIGVEEMQVAARATAAKVFEGDPPCVLALDRSLSGALTITGSADFVGEKCVVYSNSDSSTGMVLDSAQAPTAAGFCSAGGIDTNHVISPPPRRHCEVVDDPFRNLIAPTRGYCDHTAMEVSPNQTAVLKPGSYCGGLTLKGKVTLGPGEYVVSGELVITSQATVTGDGVTFSLTGAKAGFTIDAGGVVSLTAPTSGPMGGILIIQDRYANPGYENRLAGGAAATLVGAVYTPTQKITITGSAGFGQNSPFMPIIADQVRISGSNVSRVDQTGITLAAPLPKTESGARLVE